MSRLDSFQQKPWYYQLALFGAVALVAYGAFWYFVTSGVREETRNVVAEVDKLRGENARAQAASQRLSEFKAAYARSQADYEDLKALLPEQRELTNVLLGVQERARGKLTLTRFTPKDDVQQDNFSGKPVEVEVSSSYNQLGAFFAQMASYQRIVSISDFKLSRLKESAAGGRTVNAQFLLTAYYVSNEKLQNAAKPAANQPAAPAAPAPAKPAAH